MTVYENGADLTGARVIALGFFDGVHIGHRKILDTARAEAKRLGIPLAAFTFSLDSGIKDDRRIYTEEERMHLLGECGVDEVIVASFQDMKNLSGEDFVNEYLIAKFGCEIAVVGEDFRFGRCASSGAKELFRLMGAANKRSITVGEVTIGGERVSTTKIKDLLAKGEITAANTALGSPYLIISSVAHGRAVGRTLGFPTLNCDVGQERPLRHGVYASSVVIGGEEYSALTNIGICPTFDIREAHAETFILNFNREIYNERVKIYLHGFLRDEVRFSTKEALISQINTDIENAKEFF